MREKRLKVLLFCILLTIMAIIPIPADAQTVPFENSRYQGPYVDSVLFKFFGDMSENRVALSLQNDEIDMYAADINLEYVPQLTNSQNVELQSCPRNGYGLITINCAKYPFNLTAFRQAFAFAFDKYGICGDVWQGLAEPHDAALPCMTRYSIEATTPYSYYSAESIIGNQLLDEAQFLDIDADGWREAPDGTEFHVNMEYALGDDPDPAKMANYAVNALHSLGISAEQNAIPLYEFTSKLDYHLDYDMMPFGYTWETPEEVYLYMASYTSDLIDFDYMNAPNWSNLTYDQCVDQFLQARTLEEVEEPIKQMQRIIFYECPIVPLYENTRYYAYRTDEFENHVFSWNRSIVNRETYVKVHRRLDAGGPWGGTFRVGSPSVDSLNPMRIRSNYERNIVDCLAMSLEWGFADSCHVLFHEDEPSGIPKGHTRIVFELIRNASWSDGLPITAEDVAFSLNYYYDSLIYGNPAGVFLQDMTAAYAASPYRLVVEFSTESIWHEHNVATSYILPRHSFKDIGLEGWRDWEPVSVDAFLSSGPFSIGDSVPGEFLQLIAHQDWAYGLFREPTMSNPPPSSTPITTTEGRDIGQDLTIQMIAAMFGAALVIVPGWFFLNREQA